MTTPATGGYHNALRARQQQRLVMPRIDRASPAVHNLMQAT
jgi:hypothetical protein